MVTGLRQHIFIGLISYLGLCAAVGRARGDAPPMPPCPPGWEQVGQFECREPIKCPAGWRLDKGPVCVPWECSKAQDCNWKGFIPCLDAQVCAPAGGGRAVRVCETAGAACPSGLSCQPRKLCGNFPDVASRNAGRFGNWNPPPQSAQQKSGPTPTPPPQKPPTPPAKPPTPAARPNR